MQILDPWCARDLWQAWLGVLGGPLEQPVSDRHQRDAREQEQAAV
jgi:hypothetical protein